jgi:diguanylate cyclase (GGDEF)-like protein
MLGAILAEHFHQRAPARPDSDGLRLLPTAKTCARALDLALRCLLLCLAWACLPAQAAVRYGQEAGLPSSQVQSLAFDERGFLWIGTQDGVVRFDSHRFEEVDIDRGQAVPDPYVRHFLAVPGALYMATALRLLRLDLRTQALQRIDGSEGEISDIVELARDADGELLAVTESGRLFRWRDQGAAPVPLQSVSLALEAGNTINTMAVGRDALWLGTLWGVARVARGSASVEPVALDLPELDGGRAHVSAIHEDGHGELWVGFWNDGLARHDPARGRTQWLHPRLGNSGGLRSTSIHSFAERGDTLYIGSNRGIATFERGCDCLRALNLPEWDTREGSGVIVTGLITEPGSDGLWAGVWGTGVVRFSAMDKAIERQVPVEGRANSLAHPLVYSLLVDDVRRLWIGTYGGGVHVVDAELRQPGLHWPLRRIDFGQRRIESRFIWHLRQRADALLIGSGAGLFHFDGERLIDTAPELLSVRSSLELGDGRLLVGTAFGLFMDDSGGRAAPRRLKLEGAGERVVWSMQRVGEEIWLGTDRGIERLGTDLGVLGRIGVGSAARDLPGATVWTQKHDPQGRLWLGTSGGLVSVEQAADGPRLSRHPRLAELGVRGVGSIEFGKDGALWLGTSRGLVHYHPERGVLDLLDGEDGLVGTQINVGASASDGQRLYFGGVGGLVAFAPGALPARSTAMRPAVVGWRLGQEAWRPANGGIELQHEHAPLQLEFSAFHYARPGRVRYAYRWLPGESEFTELGDARSAVFSRLPPGAQRLELRASLDGPVPASAQREVFSVQVAPAWFATWWGMGLIGGSVLLLWIGFHRLRLRQAQLYARGLEREVGQRTRELSEAKAALESANAQLSEQVVLDPLTGLANRRGLLEAAAALQAQRATPQLLLVDLDHFKRINDAHGHEVGDRVLVDFAQLLQSQVRRDCMCARYGGEEFVVLMRDGDAAAVDALSERLVRATRERTLEVDGLFELRYTISIGSALGSAGEPAMALIQRADRALYRAKAAGRDCWMREDEQAS